MRRGKAGVIADGDRMIIRQIGAEIAATCRQGCRTARHADATGAAQYLAHGDRAVMAGQAIQRRTGRLPCHRAGR